MGVAGAIGTAGVAAVVLAAGATVVVAGAVFTAGCAGVVCGTRILELIGSLSLSLISSASDLPPLAVGVLCVVREPDAAGVAADPPGVVAALLISDPVCEPSRRSEELGAAPALLVTTVGVGKTEIACGPWSTVVSTDDCLPFFADLAADLAFRFRLSSSAFRNASRSCRFSRSSAALRGGGGGICVD